MVSPSTPPAGRPRDAPPSDRWSPGRLVSVAEACFIPAQSFWLLGHDTPHIASAVGSLVGAFGRRVLSGRAHDALSESSSGERARWAGEAYAPESQQPSRPSAERPAHRPGPWQPPPARSEGPGGGVPRPPEGGEGSRELGGDQIGGSAAVNSSSARLSVPHPLAPPRRCPILTTTRSNEGTMIVYCPPAPAM